MNGSEFQMQLKDKQGDADLAGSHQRSKALLGPSIGGERKEFEGFNADEVYKMFVDVLRVAGIFGKVSSSTAKASTFSLYMSVRCNDAVKQAMIRLTQVREVSLHKWKVSSSTAKASRMYQWR